MRKSLITFLIVASALTLRAAILANEDFGDGTAHWKGDAVAGDPASVGIGASPGIVVNLNDSRWTKIYQSFEGQEKKLNISITFQTSPDCAFSPDKLKVNGDIGQIIGLRLKKGHPIVLAQNTWLVLLVDPATNLVNYIAITPHLGVTASQTITSTIPGLAVHSDKMLYLAFPPGKGSVTLTNVSLTSADQ